MRTDARRLGGVGGVRRNESPLLKKFLRLEVKNEQPFAYRDGDRLIVGTIDRLVRIYEGDRLIGADIIDFKTDLIEGKKSRSLAAKTEYYRPQVAAYRRAVAGMTGLAPEKITARLLFVTAGIVQSV
jgi:ATP-dependent exoDNAse (exonuclease V) beta subunit